MVYIYVLELQDGHYYVGKSDNPIKRIEDHTSGNGSYWCKKYAPIVNIETFPDCNDFDEDKKVKELMLKHGIDNVRGGTYVQVYLTEAVKTFITKELHGATDICWKCGEKGHFIKQCPTINKESKILCQRCNRNTHTDEKCYAKTKRDGTAITSNNPIATTSITPIVITTSIAPSTSSTSITSTTPITSFVNVKSISCSRCGRSSHTSDKCYAKIDINVKSISCSRCGRSSHTSDKCYAKVHINGNNLEEVSNCRVN